MLEVEVKYKITKETWDELCSFNDPSEIHQGFLLYGPDWHTRIRIHYAPRNSQLPVCTLTTKTDRALDQYSNPDVASRIEVDSVIDELHAKQLLKNCPHVVRKQRISFKSHNKVIDVDYFYEFGLYVAEVETSNLDINIGLLKLPSWIGEKITGDEKKKYSNITLAKRGR